MISSNTENEDYEPRGESLSSRVLEPDLDIANARTSTFMDRLALYFEEYSYLVSTFLTTILFLAVFFITARIVSYLKKKKNQAMQDSGTIVQESPQLSLNNMALKKALQNRNNEKQVLKRRLRWYVKYYKHSKVCRSENHEMCVEFKDDPNVDDVNSDVDFQGRGYLESDIIRRDKKIRTLRIRNNAKQSFLEHHNHKLSTCVGQFEKDYMESLTDTGLEPFSVRTYEKCLNDLKVVLHELKEFLRKEQDCKPQEPKEYSDDDDDTYYSLATAAM